MLLCFGPSLETCGPVHSEVMAVNPVSIFQCYKVPPEMVWDGRGIRFSIGRISSGRSVTQTVDPYSSFMDTWLSRFGAMSLSIELLLWDCYYDINRPNSDHFVFALVLSLAEDRVQHAPR
jgi:hypothetical protein